MISQVRRARHAGHRWESRDVLIMNILSWTPTHGHISIGGPAKTYILQLCTNTGYHPEDLPRDVLCQETYYEKGGFEGIGAVSTPWYCPFIYIYLYSITHHSKPLCCIYNEYSFNLTRPYHFSYFHIYSRNFDSYFFVLFKYPFVSLRRIELERVKFFDKVGPMETITACEQCFYSF